jgi:hypothetical protein
VSYEEFYRRFWGHFDASQHGPSDHIGEAPVFGQRQPGYYDYPRLWEQGFRLVATASKRDNRLTAQFFCNGRRGHPFIEFIDPARSGQFALRGGAIARTHLNKSDCKVELSRTDVALDDENFWPAHFHWLRIALNELAETLIPKLREFSEAHQ